MTGTGYKLFEYNDKTGTLHPLFIDKCLSIPIGVWVAAGNHPTKNFAHRPGWHVSNIPDAPWLKGYDGSDTGVYRSRFKAGQRVWCRVEYAAEIDYQGQVDGLPGRCFRDRVPVNGYYKFRETGKGVWIITGAIRITGILTEEERQDILRGMGYDEVLEYAKYKAGFEKRMSVQGMFQ